jgi:hypothetical protein
LLLEQLDELGIDISKGKLNNILIENKDRYHQEKDRILAVGLQVSSFINVDDTGARHQGKNGYCTHIGNEYFSWFESTENKSRINFLKLLRAGHSDFAINMDAICYMKSNKLPQKALGPIIEHRDMIFANDGQWNDFLAENGIVKDRHVQIATEGALIGSIIEHGISEYLVIVSDDAGQFNVLLHALCWIHANRAIDKVIPFTDQAKKDLESVKDQIWQLYDGLKQYKEKPKPAAKKRLEKFFDDIFTQKTASATLNTALGRIYSNKSELLLVLERPDIPLHNNGAENAIREYVKKRKISGSTRSENGRRCRDTFTSLKKTCRKLGVSFWQYLKDRIEKTNLIPDHFFSPSPSQRTQSFSYNGLCFRAIFFNNRRVFLVLGKQGRDNVPFHYDCNLIIVPKRLYIRRTCTAAADGDSPALQVVVYSQMVRLDHDGRGHCPVLADKGQKNTLSS